MNCHEHDEELLDLGRLAEGAVASEKLRLHLEGCAPCAERLGREQALTARLKSLAAAARHAGPSEEMEGRLLEEFARRRRAGGAVERRQWQRVNRWWLAAAASLILAAGAGAGWRLMTPASEGGHAGQLVAADGLSSRPMPLLPAVPVVDVVARGFANVPRVVREPEPSRQGPLTPEGRAEFVAWPGAEALPAFESGELVRTELPASVLPLLGIAGTSANEQRQTVPADVVVGQDGMPRAVRLVR